MANEKFPPGFDPMGAEPQSNSMGALGQIMSNAGRNERDENLAYWSGALAPSGSGTGGALGNALKAQSDYRLERDKLQAQYLPLILQSMSAQFQRDAIGNILGPGGSPGGASASDSAAPTNAGPVGGTGTLSPPAGSAQPSLQPSQNSGSRLANYSIDQITALDRLTGLNLTEAWKIAKEGFERKPGSFYDIPDVGQVYVPDPSKGIGYANGKVYQLDNAGNVLGELAGATAKATKRAEAEMTPLPPTYVKKGSDEPIAGSVADYLDSTKPTAASSPTALPPTGAVQPIASPPGGGSTKPNDKDAAAILSQGLDDALDRVHQLDPKTTDAATLKRASDDVNGFAKEMKRRNIGYVPAALRGTPLAAEDVTPQAVADAGKVRLEGPAGSEAQKVTAAEAAKSGQNYQNVLHDKVEEEFQLVNRNKQIMPLLDKIQTGGIAPDARVDFANTIQNTTSLPKDSREALAKWVANGDPTAGKVLQNQLAAAGIVTMLQTLDKEGKPNRAIFEAVRQAQEGLKSGNTTLKDVFELQNRLYKIHYDEQQALTGAIKQGSYDPRTWAGDYSKIRNADLEKPASPLPSAKKPGIDIDALVKKYGG